MRQREQKIRTWDDTDNYYPILEVVAGAEAEEGERPRVSKVLRRAIREYLERLGIFTLRDAQGYAARLPAMRAALAKKAARKGSGTWEGGGK
jgi:hypothetical protein